MKHIGKLKNNNYSLSFIHLFLCDFIFILNYWNLHKIKDNLLKLSK